MSTSDALFRLVKSLSKSEKRYFRLSASVYGGNKNYLKLFDVLDGMKENDEQKVRSKLKGEKFIENNYFKEKTRLFDLLLESLNSYRKDKVDNRIKEYLKSAVVLQERALDDQALAYLEKAKQLAGDHNKIWYLPEILFLEEQWYGRQYLSSTQETIIKEFEARYRYAIAALSDLFDSISIQRKVIYTSLKVGQHFRSEAQEEALLPVMEQARKMEERGIVFQDAKRYLYAAYCIYHSLKGDIREHYNYTLKLAEYYDEHPSLKKHNPPGYIAALSNLALAQLNLSKFAELHESIRRIRRVPEEATGKPSPYLSILVFQHTYAKELQCFIKEGRYEDGIRLVPEVEAGLNRYETLPVTYRIITILVVSQVFFWAEDYKNALKWINRMLETCASEPASRVDLISSAKILNLMIHYELDNHDLLEYAVKSAYRHLLKKQTLFRSENLILKYFRKLPRIDTREKQQMFFTELKGELELLQEDLYERSFFEYFDYVKWLDEKVRGIR